MLFNSCIKDEEMIEKIINNKVNYKIKNNNKVIFLIKLN